MRAALKTLLNLICQLLILPFAAICKVEELISNSELLFNTCAQFMAILPGLPGAFLRRAFYTLALEKCSSHCHIGFGTIFSHRNASVGDHVYIGSYALIGSAALEDHCLIGSRVSIISGKALHVLDENGMWTPYSAERTSTITISRNVWVGEGAIIIADIGENCMVGAGSVITSNIKPGIIVAGNPARFVKKLSDDLQP